MLGLAHAAVVFFATGEPRAQPSVEWDAGASLAAGTACVNGIDAFVISAGNDVSVAFSNLGAALKQTGPVNDRQTCTVRIPANVPSQTFPAELLQTYTYGVQKSVNASGVLDARVRFFGFNVAPLTLDFPRGASLDVAGAVTTRTDPYARNSPWFGSWCVRERRVDGTLQVDFTAKAERADASEKIVLFTDGLGLRYDFQAKLESCR